jgi:cyclopropane fatty-acyl-phospholipid synthase-like methyltransferase
VKHVQDAALDTSRQTVDTARQAVGRYYDRNTRGFLAAGEGGKSLSIHRGIWAPGVATSAQAAGYVPGLMLQQAREAGARKILDLGCGVGGTCIFLAESLGAGTVPGNLRAVALRITGMTISGAQARLGCSLVARRGLADRVSLIQGDYTDPASFAGLPPQDLVVALESFIHSPDLKATLANATAALKPGGRLVICDDMIMDDTGSEENQIVDSDIADSVPTDRDNANSVSSDREFADFRRCWHAYGLTTRDALARLCQDQGLHLLTEMDLSPLLRLFRPRDRLAAFFLPALRLFRNWPWAQNLVGGTALQRLLAQGSLGYRYQVWVKPL